jgi:hypothetical protein
VGVSTQRSFHINNKLRLDRKERLDELDFVWKVEGPCNFNDQLWRQHYEELVEFKRKNGHCVVPWGIYEQDNRSLADWIRKQRNLQSNDKIRLGRKTLLDKIGVAWNWKDKGALKYHNHTHNDKIGDQQHAELETTEPGAQDHAERGEMGAGTNQRDKATATSSCSFVEEDSGRDDNDSKPSLVTSSDAPTGSYPEQEVVQEEEEAPGEIPSGWKVFFFDLKFHRGNL